MGWLLGAGLQGLPAAHTPSKATQREKVFKRVTLRQTECRETWRAVRLGEPGAILRGAPTMPGIPHSWPALGTSCDMTKFGWPAFSVLRETCLGWCVNTGQRLVRPRIFAAQVLQHAAGQAARSFALDVLPEAGQLAQNL